MEQPSLQESEAATVDHSPDAPASEQTADASQASSAAGAADLPELLMDDEIEAGEDSTASEGSDEAQEDAGEQSAQQDPAEDPASESDSGSASGSGEGSASEVDPEELELEEDVDPEEMLRCVTALVFTSPDPLGVQRMANLLGLKGIKPVREALEALSERLKSAGLPLELRQLAGGWRLCTEPEMAETVAELVSTGKVERITPAALESLAIVAYRQPVTKAEIEAIRGVQSGPILRTLVDRGLVRITGRSDQPGGALQYGTTRSFLDRFGLGSLKDLPKDGELNRD